MDEVSDVLECSAIVCSQVFVVLASVTNQVPGVLDDKKNVYNYVMEPINPMSSYQYVPTLVSMSTVGFSIAHTVMYGAIYGMLMYEIWFVGENLFPTLNNPEVSSQVSSMH